MKQEIYKNLEFIYDEENGTTCCKMEYDGQEFYATAVCAPEDMDVISKKVGQEIAFHRAIIKILQYEKMRLKHEHDGLKSLYYSIKHSKKFNPKSYEAKMLKHQMHMRENDIDQLKVDIKTTKQYIKNYIEQKDTFHDRLRRVRLKEEQAK